MPTLLQENRAENEKAQGGAAWKDESAASPSDELAQSGGSGGRLSRALARLAAPMEKMVAYRAALRKESERQRLEALAMELAARSSLGEWPRLQAALADGALAADRGNGLTALIVAAQHGNFWMVQALLPQSDPKHATREDGKTALMAAALAEDNAACLRELIPVSDLRQKNAKQESAWTLAIANRSISGVCALLEAEPSLARERLADGEPALHAIAKWAPPASGVWAQKNDADLRMDDFLLRIRPFFDLKEVDSAGETPLMAAARSAHKLDSSFEQWALASDLNARNARGRTALAIAARGAKSERVKTLLRLGADANILDNQGRSPLSSALDRFANRWSGSGECVALLLPKSQLPTSTQSRGFCATPAEEGAGNSGGKQGEIPRGAGVSTDEMAGACRHALNSGQWELADELLMALDQQTAEGVHEEYAESAVGKISLVKGEEFAPKWRARTNARAQAAELQAELDRLRGEQSHAPPSQEEPAEKLGQQPMASPTSQALQAAQAPAPRRASRL